MAHTCIKTANGLSDHASVDQIAGGFFDFVNPYIEDHRAVVYIEHILFAQKGKGTARAEANGVLKWNLRQEGIPVFGVVPNAVNSFIGHLCNIKYPSGRKDGLTTAQRSKRIKQLTMSALHEHFNFYTRDDNVADSYAIALFGYSHCIEKRRISAIPLYARL